MLTAGALLRARAMQSKIFQRPVLTVDEAAKFLTLSRQATYEAVRRREIPSVRIGRRILVPRAGLEALLAGATVSSAKPASKVKRPARK